MGGVFAKSSVGKFLVHFVSNVHAFIVYGKRSLDIPNFKEVLRKKAGKGLVAKTLLL